MKLETLAYFMEVGHAQSINKAAKHLQLPQQTLSKAIKSLETELGVQLFTRSAQGVVLTEAGADVLSFAHWCVSEYQRLWPEQVSVGQTKQKLSIAVVETANQLLLPQVMSLLYRQDLGLTLQVQRETDHVQILSLVEAGQVDLGIIICYQKEDVRYPELDQSLLFWPLYTSKPYFWVNKHHPLAAKKSLSYRDMGGHKLMFITGSDVTLGERVLAAQGCLDQPCGQADNIYYLAQMVKDDLAIASDMKTNGHLHLETVLAESAVALPLNKRETYPLVTGLIVRREAAEREAIQRVHTLLKNSI